jgi:ATP-dependent Lhr-like helicase
VPTPYATASSLTLKGETLVGAAALLKLWGSGWVEPVTPTPEPRHIVAQQMMALCLQEHQIGDQTWRHGWNGLLPFDDSAEPIVRHLAREGYLDSDAGMYFIGPEAEKRFGHRHFMGMTAVFLGAPEFTVLVGRNEVGKIDPYLLVEEVKGNVIMRDQNGDLKWWTRAGFRANATSPPRSAR